jgi:hypothetical protein
VTRIADVGAVTSERLDSACAMIGSGSSQSVGSR